MSPEMGIESDKAREIECGEKEFISGSSNWPFGMIIGLDPDRGIPFTSFGDLIIEP